MILGLNLNVVLRLYLLCLLIIRLMILLRIVRILMLVRFLMWLLIRVIRLKLVNRMRLRKVRLMLLFGLLSKHMRRFVLNGNVRMWIMMIWIRVRYGALFRVRSLWFVSIGFLFRVLERLRRVLLLVLVRALFYR